MSMDCQKKTGEKFSEWMDMVEPDEEKKNPWVLHWTWSTKPVKKQKQDLKNRRIDVNMKYETYCNAISDGGVEEWDFAWKRWEQLFKGEQTSKQDAIDLAHLGLFRYTESTVASEKSTLLSSLGCTKEVWLLNRSLLQTKSSKWFLHKNCGS